jgi:hypothetical protein
MRYPDPYPPALDNYLNSTAVTSKIGSHHTWQETNMDVYNNFAVTGDWMRTSRPDLEKVINAGVRTVIYDGDADYIVNLKGIEAMVRAHPPPTFPLSFFYLALRADNPGLWCSTGCLSKHEILERIRAAEVRELHCPWRVRGSLQERGHILVHALLWRGTRSPSVYVARRTQGCGGAANVHADHVGQAADWHMMPKVEGMRPKLQAETYRDYKSNLQLAREGH